VSVERWPCFFVLKMRGEDITGAGAKLNRRRLIGNISVRYVAKCQYEGIAGATLLFAVGVTPMSSV
jgi:hypothetical protein